MMRTAYEIQMVRDERGIWVAPWELGQVRTTAAEQAASAAAESTSNARQDKQSWAEFLYSLLPRWKDRSQHLSQQPA